MVDSAIRELVVETNCLSSLSMRLLMKEVLFRKPAVTEVLVRMEVKEVLPRFSGHPSTESGRRAGEPPPLTNFPTITHRLYVKDTRKPTTAP